MPNGEKRPIDFETAEKIFCGDFPRRDTYEPPAEEGKSSLAAEAESDVFAVDLDDRRFNE